MIKKNLYKKNISNFFISMILLICSYNMDINKSYTTKLTNQMVQNYLQNSNVAEEIILYVKTNLNFCGNIIYLTNNADSECMIFISGNYCSLVFIGTQLSLSDHESLFKDMITNLTIGLKQLNKNYPDVKIHSKYIENMKNENLINRIIKVIKKINCSTINICAHSMGCGLGLYTSIISCAKYKNKKFNLITFDSPKLGNSELNKYVKKIKNLTHYNFINNHDIVPLYPPVKNYKLIACDTCIIQSDGKIAVCKNFENKMSIFTNYSVKDHYSQNILHSLFLSLKKYMNKQDPRNNY